MHLIPLLSLIITPYFTISAQIFDLKIFILPDRRLEGRIPNQKLAGVSWSGELRVSDNVRLCVRKLTFIKLTFKINFERQ